MPEEQLIPQFNAIAARFKKGWQNAKTTADGLVQETQQAIEERFALAIQDLETAFNSSDNRLKKDALAAVALLVAFKARMLEILIAAWALMVRLPRALQRRYGSSVVETTLAALTAALMWARKAEAAAQQPGKTLGWSAALESLLNQLSELLKQHSVYIARMVAARTNLVSALARLGMDAPLAEARANQVLTTTHGHLRKNLGVALLQTAFQKLESARTSDDFGKALGDIFDNFQEYVGKMAQLLGTGAGLAAKALTSEVEYRLFAFENRDIFTAAADHGISDQRATVIQAEVLRIRNEIAKMESGERPTEEENAACAAPTPVPRPTPPVGGKT